MLRKPFITLEEMFTTYSGSISVVLAMTLVPQATGGGSGVVATVGEAGSVCCCCWGVAVDGRLMAGSSSSFWESAVDWSSIVSLKLGPSGDDFSLKTETETHQINTPSFTTMEFMLFLYWANDIFHHSDFRSYCKNQTIATAQMNQFYIPVHMCDHSERKFQFRA